MRSLITFLALILAVLPFTGCSQKQNKTGVGAIRGTVVNELGSQVAGATVYIDNSKTGQQTDSDGYFYVADVATGKRNIKVESFGHQTWLGVVEVKDTEITENYQVSLRILITNFRALFQEPSTLILTWDTPQATETILEYGKASGEYTRKLRENQERKSHSVTLAGIDTTITYYYRIRATETEWTEEQTISIAALDRPEAVVLNSPSSIGATSVSLTWSQSQETDFNAYLLYRSSVSSVLPGDGNSILVSTSLAPEQSYFLDQSLAAGGKYYYRVFVQDDRGYMTGSNTVYIETYTEPNVAPIAVVLSDPQSITQDSMTLTWTQSMDSDFYAYRIYYSTLAGVSEKSTLLTTVMTWTQTSYQVQGLNPDTQYTFKVFVVDRGGLTAGSNEVSATTAAATNTAPAAVVISEAVPTGPSTVRLTWSKSTETDFQVYRIYYSRVSGAGTAGTLYSQITNQDLTSLIVSGLLDNTTYYFTVHVVDDSGLSTSSAEISATTTNDFPPATNLTALSPVSASSITLTWTAVNITDFESYRIMRSSSSGVTEASTLVSNIISMTQTSFIDFDVSLGKTYYYRIFTRDSSGLSTGGNELYVTAMTSAAMNGAILADTLWTTANSPITIIGDLTVNSGATLTIEPGVQVLFNAGSDSLSSGNDTGRCELIVAGTLKVNGTAGSPVSFNSAAAVRNVGDWGGIWIQSTSTSTVLTNFEISNARDYGILLDASATLTNGTVFLNLQNGIKVGSGAAPAISLCRVSRNSVGILSENSANPVISSSNLVQNNSYAVSGGGVLGLTAASGSVAGTGGNYVAGNNGLTATIADLTGYTASKGTADGTMDTSSDTSPEQILNVDAILTAQSGEISGAGAQ